MATPKNNSVIKAFEILNAFSSGDKALTAPEVAEAVGLNISTTHRFLLTLEEIGAVLRSPGNRYHLGMLVAELGRRVTRRDALAERARVHVDALAQKLGETTSLASFEGNRITFLAWHEPVRPLVFNFRRDAALPLHCSSLGKIFLAGLHPLQAEEVMGQLDLTRFTDNTIVDLSGLRREIRSVAASGYARDRQEFEIGLDCIATAIRDPDDQTIAALSISAPSTRLNEKTEEVFKKELSRAASLIRQSLFVESKTLSTKAKPRGRFPHIKRVGNFAFVSGTSARKPDETFAGVTKKKSGELEFDIRVQTRATIANVADILASVGSTLADIVEIEAYLADMADYDAFNEAYAEFFGEDGPTRTTVAVKALPHPHQLLMIKAVAHVPVPAS
ncbi:IclR family transcriptional regulator domain-containing protein [Ensifer adhaerens]|uniref:IclR family transcriptional regulator domain-containing protein n=1 Tax=Ensifer adhaerens TaxID=106592 RepID=UPI0030B81E0B